MKQVHVGMMVGMMMLCCSLFGQGQQTVATSTNVVVPMLVSYSGVLTGSNGKPLTGMTGVTFSLYAEQEGGAALWLETQNVQLDKTGHYSVQLGAASSQGLPASLFAGGEARWLGVQAQGEAEQPRTLLMSVPYALKALDAETIGGKPASSFMLAPSATNGSASPNPQTDITGSGTKDYVPVFTGTTTIGNSKIYQNASGEIGIANTSPAATLDVTGTGDVRDTLTLFPNSSHPTLSVNGTAFQVSSTGKVTFVSGQTFPGTGTVTSVGSGAGLTGGPITKSGTLSIATSGVTNAMLQNSSLTVSANSPLSGGGVVSLGGSTSLGLKSCSANQILEFVSGAWTCENAAVGTITGVTAGTDLTGGGSSGNVTLNVDTTKVPQLNTNNTFTGNQAITGNLSDTGNISATGSITGQTGAFSANNTTQVVNVTQSGTGSAVIATVPTSSSSTPTAIQGSATGSGLYGMGIQGNSGAGSGGIGVYGFASNSNNGTSGYGVVGVTNTTSGWGVYGGAGSSLSDANAVGVGGETYSPDGIGVDGYNGNNTSGIGVRGYTYAASGIGMYGWWNSPSSVGSGFADIGVWGDSSLSIGVAGSSDSAPGVYGVSTANNGYVYDAGVYGQNVNGAIGVTGRSDNGEGGYLEGYYGGVNWTDQAVASYGQYSEASNSGSGISTTGVWGDSGISGSFGVAGTTDDGNSFFGINNTVNHETLYVQNSSGFVNGETPYAARFAGPGASTYCSIIRDVADNGTGDLVCTGTKSAAVPVDGNRMVRLYAVEAADNWFEDAGSAQLANGSAAVALDRVFAQTVNGDLDYHVFITPNGECEGLYVTNKTAQGFEVHELHHGNSNIAFDYRIMVRRKGFENVRMQDVTEDFARMKQETDQFAARREAAKVEQKKHPLPAHDGTDPLKKGTWKAASAGSPMPRLPMRPNQPAEVRK